MHTVPGDGVNTFLFAVYTAAYPDWGAFRGAWYDGRATHDPREQNLVANMLSRSSVLPGLPPWVRMYIARLACSAAPCIASPRVPCLRLVCRPDEAGTRLLSAHLLSKRMRRMFASIPENSSMHRLYHAWTAGIAAAVQADDGSNKVACLDPCSPVLSTRNRLRIRGFDSLDPRCVDRQSRPAYVPGVGVVREWACTLAVESGWDAMSRLAASVHTAFLHSKGAIREQIMTGRGGACTSSLIEANTQKCSDMYSKLNIALIQEQILQTAVQLYSELYSLGLNAAERDYFYMVSAAVHVGEVRHSGGPFLL